MENGRGHVPHPPPQALTSLWHLLQLTSAVGLLSCASVCASKGLAYLISPLCHQDPKLLPESQPCSQNHSPAPSSSSFPQGWGCRGLGGDTRLADRGEGEGSTPKATKGYRTLSGSYFSAPLWLGIPSSLGTGCVPGSPCGVPCEALGTGKGWRVVGTPLPARGLVPHSQGHTGIHPLLDCSLAVPQEQRDHPLVRVSPGGCGIPVLSSGRA